jgi:hypothetical protein
MKEFIDRIVRWQTVHAPSITAGRCIAFVYVIAIIAITLMLPRANATLHYTALRCLGAGTRIENALLLPATPVALEDRLRLLQERDRLIHRYLKRTVAEGGSILPADVLDWPALGSQEIVPLDLEAEPDWLIMNAGTTVDIWFGWRRAKSNWIRLAHRSRNRSCG